MRKRVCIIGGIFLVIVAIVCITVISKSTQNHNTLPARFVEVEESLICPDYQLDLGILIERYLVDRVSRRVYIHLYNQGGLDACLVLTPCLDENGDHMRYDGELPE